MFVSLYKEPEATSNKISAAVAYYSLYYLNEYGVSRKKIQVSREKSPFYPLWLHPISGAEKNQQKTQIKKHRKRRLRGTYVN